MAERKCDSKCLHYDKKGKRCGLVENVERLDKFEAELLKEFCPKGKEAKKSNV